MADMDDEVLSAPARDDGGLTEAPLDDEAAGKGGLSARKLLLIVIPILVIGVMAALYFTGVLDKKGEKTAEVTSAMDAPKGGLFMDLPDLLVNLSGTGGQSRFLKLKVKLEVSSPEDLLALEAVTPRVIDQFQTFLREMRVQDMRGSAGIYRLRQELLYRVNMAAAPVKVKDVLFQEILIQ